MFSRVFNGFLFFWSRAVRFYGRAWLARTASIKRELSPSDAGAGPVNLKMRAWLWLLSAPPLMEDVKVENVEENHTSGGGVELNSAGRNATESFILPKDLCEWCTTCPIKDSSRLYSSLARVLAKMCML